MEQVTRSSPARTSRSRSPSVGAHPVSERSFRRKITVIDGAFQSQTDLDRSQTPPPSIKTSVSPPTLEPYSPVDIPQHRAMTSPPLGNPRLSVDTRSSRASNGCYSLTQLDTLGLRPTSPSLSWRSSTSSLADTAVSSLICPPSSENNILHDIKNQMVQSFRHARHLQNEIHQIPKLKSDVNDLNKEREKLLNELLEQRALVLQLKQRVTLLHEQNQELAKLAQSDTAGSGNAKVLAIRNTLVATLAQLKQMEDQIQTIPSLKSHIRELEEQKRHLQENQTTVAIPSDLPEGMSPDQYQALVAENAKLKGANEKLLDEMRVVSRHLNAVSESCEGLQSRMEIFQNTQAITQPLQERIKKLESEKDALYQELVDAKYHHRSSIDLDTAHLAKQARSLKKANSRLQNKIEHMKIEIRQQKEQLVLKLFEIESLNVKTSKYEIEKQVLEMEQLQVQSEPKLSLSPPAIGPVPVTLEIEEDVSPDDRALILKFQQLEVHSYETQNILKTFISERQEMEARITELNVRVSQSGISELERKLEESESKLELARERIKTLEKRKASRLLSPEQQVAESNEESLKLQVSQMEKELNRLSSIERQSINNESQLHELEKLKSEKQKLERKFKEGRKRLKSLASELASSADLVKQYQAKCSAMEEEITKNKLELTTLQKEHADIKAQLEVKDVELQSSMQAGLNGASATTSLAVSELQEKYEHLSSELSHLTEQRQEQDRKLTNSQKEVQNLQEQLSSAKLSEEMAKSLYVQLENRLKQLESSLNEAEKHKESLDKISKLLSDKTKTANELQIQYSELQSTHDALHQENKSYQEKIQVLTSQVTSLTSDNESLKQKVDILSQETPTLIQQSAELRVARDEAERKIQALHAQHEITVTQVSGLEDKLHHSEALCKELKSKLRLLQSDLDEAETNLDQTRSSFNEVKSENQQLREEMHSLHKTLLQKDSELYDISQKRDEEKQNFKEMENRFEAVSKQYEDEKSHSKSLEADLTQVRTIEIPKLHSELAKTVSEMGQLTTDYSSRVNRMRELETLYQQSESEKQEISGKLSTVEKKMEMETEKSVSLKDTLQKTSEELKDLQSTHMLAVGHNQKLNEELRKLKDEVKKLNEVQEKKVSESKSLKEECANLKEKLKANQLKISSLETELKQSKDQSHKSNSKVATTTQEMQTLKTRVQELENQCEMLTATRDNLLHRLDKMEKLEMDYELLKQRIQDVLGQSSQLKNDNKALLQLLEGVEMEMPALEKEVTRNLQEENLELQQQVSLLSQWNDKHHKNIATLESQIEAMEEEKKNILVELMQAQNYEQENRQLKKELGEVEIEVNRIKRQAHAELEEEMKVKVETQAQLLSIFNEHNKALQIQVGQLQKQIKELGGSLARETPVSPPPMPEVSENLQFISSDARRCSELEFQNASLQQQLAKLQAELIVAQEISPVIRRRSSTLLALTSVPFVPSNEDTFVSVPEEMLLPCSILADAFINKTELSEEVMQSYLQTIGDGWFNAVAQKSITSSCLQCYVTTFNRLSPKLLDIIVNMQDIRGNSALHHTLANANFPAVSILLDLKCCNTNITNKAGYTPLMLAAAHNIKCGENKPVLQKLLSKTDINIRSKVELQTALMLAVSSGSLELISLFLEYGADINAQDKDGSTSLMFACEKGHAEIVQKLLSNPSCNVLLKDNDGQTAYNIASSIGHNEICTLLKKYHKHQSNKR